MVGYAVCLWQLCFTLPNSSTHFFFGTMDFLGILKIIFCIVYTHISSEKLLFMTGDSQGFFKSSNSREAKEIYISSYQCLYDSKNRILCCEFQLHSNCPVTDCKENGALRSLENYPFCNQRLVLCLWHLW